MTKQNQDSPVNRGSVAVPRTPRPSIRPTGIQSEASRQPGENREASALGRSVVHCDGTYVQTRRTTDGDEFDDWLDAMLAHAWREGVKAGAKVAYDMTPMADSWEDDEQVRRDIDAAVKALDNPYGNRGMEER